MFFLITITLTLALNQAPEFTYILLYITQITIMRNVQVCSDTQVHTFENNRYVFVSYVISMNSQ